MSWDSWFFLSLLIFPGQFKVTARLSFEAPTTYDLLIFPVSVFSTRWAFLPPPVSSHFLIHSPLGRCSSYSNWPLPSVSPLIHSQLYRWHSKPSFSSPLPVTFLCHLYSHECLLWLVCTCTTLSCSGVHYRHFLCLSFKFIYISFRRCIHALQAT